MKNDFDTIGFIPLRKGSKGIKNKNKILVLGRPLFSYVLVEAIFSSLDRVYVYTDDLEIINFIKQEYSWTDKIYCIERPEITATDTASTEYSIECFLDSIDIKFKYLCLLQATSPLTTKIDIDNALKLLDRGYDSILSVVNIKRFLWNKNGTPINYDFKNRPLRQNFEGTYVENGAIYITKRESFLQSKCRLSGKIGLYEMPEDTFYELDEENDLIVLEKLLEQRLLKLKKAKKPIKALFLDVDGTLTDGTVIFGENTIYRTFSVLDGMGIELAKREGIEVFFLSSENSEDIKKRAKKLNLEYFGGIKDKYGFLENILIKKGMERAEIAYIGDDINDVANLLASSLSIVPLNAQSYIKNYADFVVPETPGKNFVRNCIELILKYNKRRF